MINIGKLTGEYDKATGYIGVELSNGEDMLARPMNVIPVVANYTEAWVKKYGEFFMAVVAYENNERGRPLLIGLLPYKNPKFPEEGYENNYFFTSEKFRLWLNDDANEMVLDCLEEGIIKMVDKDVTEPAVLGDVAMDLLIEFTKDLGNLSSIVTSTGVTSTINSSPQWSSFEDKWNKKWEDFKSERVFLR